ncbi:type II secretion system F family protein [Paenibacillus thailandensis]|uniref:Type II secretion system F family protein n=1 Tax=Paenibacillus thailandensis TaxID=393250 RepID=A0ABW5QWV0_9BACL
MNPKDSNLWRDGKERPHGGPVKSGPGGYRGTAVRAKAAAGQAGARAKAGKSKAAAASAAKRWMQRLAKYGPESAPDGNGSSANSLVDYGEYRLSRRQFWEAAVVGYAAAFCAAYLFYHNLFVSLALGCAGLAAPKLYRKRLLRNRQERLKLQFKEALYSITSSLAAGRSVENAFMSALEDLKLLYPDPRTELILEFQIIRNRLVNSEPLEYALRSLASRARIDDLTQFADVFAACKRSGGDLIEVMKRSSQTIGEKLDIQQEIAVMVAQKRFEARIMMAVPFVFLGFLHMAAPDYMAPLYGGAGYVLLTVVLGVLLVCFRIIFKIMDIRM